MKKGIVFIILIFIGCKPKSVGPSQLIYPDTIYLQGICGSPTILSWRLGGGYPYCGWECIIDYNQYTHIEPDYYELFWGETKSNLTKYKTISPNNLSFNDILPTNKSFFLQLKAVYSMKQLTVLSNVIQVSSDKIPQAQLITDISDKSAYYDLNGDIFRYAWSYNISRTTNTKAIIIGKNNKNEYGTWFYDFVAKKQTWLWKSYTQGVQWSPDGSKAILGKSLDPKPYNEVYIFNTTDFAIQRFSDPKFIIGGRVFL